MRILMHICCSNCSIYPLQKLFLKGMDIRGLWFNPNIHPYTEYIKRLESLQKLQKFWDFDVEYNDDYALDDFLGLLVGKGSRRCESCYQVRLEKTAEIAKKMSMDCFTTSLLASPYQRFDMIKEIGNSIGKRHGLLFYAEDMRQGWHLSRNLSREFGLYSQKYCGCIYSEMERFRNKN